MANINTIIKACRAYLLRSRAVPIAVSAVLTAAFAALALNSDLIFGEELNLMWLFLVLGALTLVFLLREVYVDVFSKPGRLRVHLSNLPSEERARVIDEFTVTTPEHGRYFLRDFVIFFPFDSGIIRYSKIDEVSVYPNSIGISGGGRLFFLKTEKSESPAELAQKLRDRIPDKPEEPEDEDIEDELPDSGEIEVTEDENNGENEDSE